MTNIFYEAPEWKLKNAVFFVWLEIIEFAFRMHSLSMCYQTHHNLPEPLTILLQMFMSKNQLQFCQLIMAGCTPEMQEWVGVGGPIKSGLEIEFA